MVKLRWLKEKQAGQDPSYEDRDDDLAKLEHASSAGILSEAEKAESGEIIVKLKELDSLEIDDLKQKAKLKWVAEGDENTNVFHGMINGRHKRNQLHGLTVNGGGGCG